VRIIPFSEVNRYELFTLLRTCLGEKETIKRDELFWSWKHEQNPFGSSLVLFGKEGDQLVGVRAFLRWNWQSNGRFYKALRAVDTVTHPDHQRKGIFSKLTSTALEKAKEEGIDFLYNTPNQNSMPGYLKMGWQEVGLLPMFIKVLEPISFAARLAKNIMLKKEGRIDVTRIISDLPYAGPWLTENARAIERLIDIDSNMDGRGLTTVRSLDYLLWRYSSHPYINYHVVEARVDGELRGVIFCRANQRRGLREVMVNELLLSSPDIKLVQVLTKMLSSSVHADYLIAHFGSASEHLPLLRKCGFHQISYTGMNFTVRDLGKTIVPDPLVIRNWSLCLGDLEIF